ECPNAAIDGAIPEPARQGLSSLRRGLFHARGTARLDLISQWGTLTVGDRRIAGRWCLASSIHGVHRYIRKSCSVQVGANFIGIVVAMRGARQKTRRIIRKNRRQRTRDGVGKIVFGNPIPYIKNKITTGLQNTPRLLVARNLVWKKHDAKLASH